MNPLSEIFKRITATLNAQFMALTAFAVQLQTIGTRAAQFVQQKIQKFMQTLLKNPSSKEDYWQVLGIYISKKFAIISAMVLGVVGYLIINFAYPWAEGKLWYASFKYDTPKYSKFSGKAKVYDTAGVMIYMGQMENGKPNGQGMQYDSKGNLIYKGNFEAGKYSGQGEVYNLNGGVIYSGNFVNNNYDGEGKLYNDAGKVLYSGQFVAGQRSGTGIEYDASTEFKKYYGQFANDTRNGKGVEYEADGTSILYEGAFKDGVYSGEGKLYSNGNLLYSGNFSNGKYDGQGNLYDNDTGLLVYAGEFSNGVYSGTGKLYEKGTLAYTGEFENGKKQGTGDKFDILGSKIFSGTFRNDSIDYIAYLGKSPDDIAEEFGQESFRTEVDNHLIITYLSLDASMVFKVDETTNSYVCEKAILGVKKDFMGLGSKSTAIERRQVMGDPFSSINYSCPDYYKTVFANLSINFNNINRIPSDKYIMDKYFIRFYFNEGRTELKSVEICLMG